MNVHVILGKDVKVFKTYTVSTVYEDLQNGNSIKKICEELSHIGI